MQSNLRTTLRDVAKVAEVSAMSVSLALRESPKLPVATRERIKRIAAEMDYRPDPMLSALNAHKTGKRIASYHGTIAFLTDLKEGCPAMDAKGPSGVLIDAIRKRAQELGYDVEVFHLLTDGKSHSVVDRCLHSRGVRAVILGYFDQPVAKIEIKWQRYCVVSLNHQINSTKFHSVMSDHYQSMRLIMTKLMEAGYTRPGYCISEHSSELADHYWLAAFLLERRHHPKKNRVDPLIGDYKDFSRKAFRLWMQRQKPDAVISLRGETMKWLEEDGYDVPGQIGFAHLDQLVPSAGKVSGIVQDRHLMGRFAVDQLNILFNRGSYGEEKTSTSLHVAGSWVDWGTTRKPTE